MSLDWVRDSWGVEDFLARGVGQCLVHGNTIASWCIGDYAAGHACEIGIHTDERYRRRGLATLAVRATLRAVPGPRLHRGRLALLEQQPRLGGHRAQGRLPPDGGTPRVSRLVQRHR